jgi:AraC family transcriptional regulator
MLGCLCPAQMFRGHSLCGQIFGRFAGSTVRITVSRSFRRTSKEVARNRSQDVPPVVENKLAPRICVRQGGESIALAPGIPTLSSAQSPWEGALLERHSHGAHTADRHQHLSHFVCLHLSEPAPFVWRSQGKTGNKILSAGSILLVSRGTEDSVSYPKPVKRILLNLEPSLLQKALLDNDTGRDVELIEQWGVADPQIEYVLRALEADLEASLPVGRLFGESLLCALAVHLQSRYSVTPPRDAKSGNGLPRARLNRVIEYIEANLDRDIDLATLAQTAGMSAHYFSELFKQSVHVSPHQYVLRRKIARARNLLNDPGVTVLEAAVRSGFSDQSYFTKIFRRIVGVTPTGYRAAL